MGIPDVLDSYKRAVGAAPAFKPGKVVAVPAGVRVPALVLAQAADYQLIVDLQPDLTAGVLGLALLQRAGLPPIVGIPAPIPAKAGEGCVGDHCGVALTLGPAYKEADASWVSLAGMPREWCELSLEVAAESNEALDFTIEYRVGGGPTLWERYHLHAAGLSYETRVEWVIGGFRLHLPVFVTDGKAVGVPRLEGSRLSVQLGAHRMTAVAEEARRWELDLAQYANRCGIYQNAYLQERSAIRYAVQLLLE